MEESFADEGVVCRPKEYSIGRLENDLQIKKLFDLQVRFDLQIKEVFDLQIEEPYAD